MEKTLQKYGNRTQIVSFLLFLSIIFFKNTFHSQVTIYSHDFDDLVGFTTDESFCNAISCGT